jgi:heme-degrading monooxygenase HmoA
VREQAVRHPTLAGCRVTPTGQDFLAADVCSPAVSNHSRRVEGDDVYARVAVYRIKSGTAQEIARKADDEGGMLKIFRAHVGFDSYELVGVGDQLISISRWQTAEQADAASMAARSWVAEHLGGSVQLEANYLGELLLSSLTPDAVGL